MLEKILELMHKHRPKEALPALSLIDEKIKERKELVDKERKDKQRRMNKDPVASKKSATKKKNKK